MGKFFKEAFKYDKPNHYKKVRLLSEKDMYKAILRQSMLRKVVGGVFKTVDMSNISPAAKFKQKKEFVKAFNKKLKDKGMNPAGTIFDTRDGRRTVAFSKKYYKQLGREGRRLVLAHELFHANRKILGNSEILAHLAGARAVKKKFGKVDPSKFKASGMTSATYLGQLKHVFSTRKVRAPLELLVPIAAAVGIKKVYNKFKNE